MAGFKKEPDSNFRLKEDKLFFDRHKDLFSSTNDSSGFHECFSLFDKNRLVINYDELRQQKSYWFFNSAHILVIYFSREYWYHLMIFYKAIAALRCSGWQSQILPFTKSTFIHEFDCRFSNGYLDKIEFEWLLTALFSVNGEPHKMKPQLSKQIFNLIDAEKVWFTFWASAWISIFSWHSIPRSTCSVANNIYRYKCVYIIRRVGYDCSFRYQI